MAVAAADLIAPIKTAVLAVVMAGLVHGCAPALGDFGRPRPSVINDDVLPEIGRFAAQQRGEPVSSFRYTDAERELRDRSWSLLMPSLPRQYFQRWLAEMRRTRILSIAETVPDRRDYVRVLLSEDFRSSGSRYIKLMIDIDADIDRIPRFIEIANIVATYDRVRQRSLDRTSELTPEEYDDALGRIWENRLLVWLVQQSVRERAAIYRYALERLLIETPDDEAVAAEAALLALEKQLGVLVVEDPRSGPIYGK